MSSRVNTTALLAKAISQSDYPPSVWISTSAVGFYPPSETQTYDEKSSFPPPEKDWLSSLSTVIEEAAEIPDPQKRTRSVMMRLGIVLGQDGGVYDKMRKPFYSCLGGTLGDGSQWFPYIHLEDVIRAYRFAIFDSRVQGPLNVVAPTACTNKEFTKALGGVIKRPTMIGVPGFVSTLIGHGRGSLLFDSRLVKPDKLTSLGFEFDFPDVTSCCEALVHGLITVE